MKSALNEPYHRYYVRKNAAEYRLRNKEGWEPPAEPSETAAHNSEAAVEVSTVRPPTKAASAFVEASTIPAPPTLAAENPPIQADKLPPSADEGNSTPLPIPSIQTERNILRVCSPQWQTL
ncbi:MAG TPA: hypothetical protein VHB73_01765, partial [Alphaproteobacteria bacterium]|nr:hypothetical protein [Alphaproteobacteria bacterium]